MNRIILYTVCITLIFTGGAHAQEACNHPAPSFSVEQNIDIKRGSSTISLSNQFTSTSEYLVVDFSLPGCEGCREFALSHNNDLDFQARTNNGASCNFVAIVPEGTQDQWLPEIGATSYIGSRSFEYPHTYNEFLGIPTLFGFTKNIQKVPFMMIINREGKIVGPTSIGSLPSHFKSLCIANACTGDEEAEENTEEVEDPSSGSGSCGCNGGNDGDGDGDPDDTDPDDDNDGTPDDEDAFPEDPEEDTDTDGDGEGDNADEDDDNDGTPDSEDAFPEDPEEDTDTDGDGEGNNADEDDDNDGTPDSEDAFPEDPEEDTDTDGDGEGDNADEDDDNDGIPDTEDTAPTDPNIPPPDTESDPDDNNKSSPLDPITGSRPGKLQLAIPRESAEDIVTETDMITSTDSENSFIKTVKTFNEWLRIAIIVVTMVVIVYAGIRLLTSGGKQEVLKSANNTLFYAGIGVGIALLSYAIISILVNFF